jgi:DNA-directed RNA polymerase beta subunit
MTSYLRRINTAMEKNDKIIEPRKIHSTSYGVICPNETPESD